MRTRQLLGFALVMGALGVAAGFGVDPLLGAGVAGVEKQDVKPAVNLPLTRVVLFNSGVGYFSRSGEVTDDARVDLAFPETDINDLLKSMVLEDFNKGRIAAVSYDSREPIARTLSSFAVNLNGNPSFAGIVAQMRGERVDVVINPGAANQPGKLAGAIVGVELQKIAAGNTTVDAPFLNLWCAEGLRSVKLTDVQQLKFANPVIESEFRRSLEVLSLSHDSQKKAVSLHFAGDGKRKVQVGYVIEAPIWKTSYRLILADKDKPYLQGWAMVENPTDEDWTGVKMAFISGRPISFRMDLYNPLYVNRPVVEPELFASLRPVTYRGAFDNKQLMNFGIGVFGGDKAAKDAKEEMAYNALRSAERPGQFSIGGSFNTDAALTGNGAGGGFAGTLPALGPLPLALGIQPPSPPGTQFQRYSSTDRSSEADRKRHAADTAAELARRIGTGTVGNAATAGALGDYFQYAIDHPVSLARQKSAMLPIVGKEIEGQRVSIYNPSVQRTHPLLGLKFKNTSGAHLNQGPITVFEGSVYAGDTRVLDVQPNEERIVSYAIDLGTEVDPQVGPGTQKITSVKANKGIITTITKVVADVKYKIVNRSQTDRTLLIEHPNRTNQQFKLIETEKPMEETPDLRRFQVAVKAGETKSFTVKEEKDIDSSVQLTNNNDDTIRYFIKLSEASPALKQKLQDALKIKETWDGTRRELNQVVADLQRLNQDQDRIRKNLRETPKEAEVYATYLKKLSDQEKEIDTLTAKQKQLMGDEFTAHKKYDDYLAAITD